MRGHANFGEALALSVYLSLITGAQKRTKGRIKANTYIQVALNILFPLTVSVLTHTTHCYLSEIGLVYQLTKRNRQLQLLPSKSIFVQVNLTSISTFPSISVIRKDPTMKSPFYTLTTCLFLILLCGANNSTVPSISPTSTSPAPATPTSEARPGGSMFNWSMGVFLPCIVALVSL